MKKLLAVWGLLALVVGFGALAQVTLPAPVSMGTSDRVQVIPGGQPTSQSFFATLTQFRAWVLGGASGHSGTPVLTSCGTGSPAVTGTDTAFRVTTGTSATGCIATFSTAFTSTPTCTAVNQTAPGTSTPAYTVSTTAVTLVQASGSGIIWNVICVGS